MATSSKAGVSMLSLSLLDAIFSIDHQGSWLKFLVTDSYLAKLCASLLWEDERLQKMLHPQPEALYIHQSKMVTNSCHSSEMLSTVGERKREAQLCPGIHRHPQAHSDPLRSTQFICGGGYVNLSNIYQGFLRGARGQFAPP